MALVITQTEKGKLKMRLVAILKLIKSHSQTKTKIALL